MDKGDVGARILAKRKELGLTQKELAGKLHVTDKTISKWETGRHFPDIAILEELASALEISVQELLGLENASSEETLTSMTEISIEEKRSVIKEIRNRGILTVVLGGIIWAALLYDSWVLANNNIFGFPQGTTAGMSGFIGIIIANGLVSIFKGRRVLK